MKENKFEMSRLFLFLCVIALCSCSGKNESGGEVEQFGREKDVEELDTLSSDEVPDTTLTIDTSDFFGKKLYALLPLLKDYDTLKNDRTLVFDRFNHTQHFKITLKKKTTVKYGKSNDVYPLTNIYYYEFKDSATAYNAIFNWLDCVGSDCQPVKLWEDSASIKTPPLYAVLSYREIVLTERPCEHEANDWSLLLKTIDKFNNSRPYAILDIKCGGPLKWVKPK